MYVTNGKKEGVESHMSELFDLSNFDEYKEDNCREVKKAEGGLPIALWESYSSLQILMGV